MNVVTKVLKLLIITFSISVIVSCASPPSSDPEALAEYQKLNDPFETANRGIFGFNQILDKLIIKPVTTIYRTIAPDVVREAIHNFLQNIKTPVIVANDLLQGEGNRAGNTIARFFINSTWGLLGFMDPATEMGFEQHEEDFGQTLAVWVVDEGPYLMLPVLGPSNPRDAIGKLVDWVIDPIHWWAANTDNSEVPLIRTGVNGVDTRDQLWEVLEDIEKNSIDPYASYRSLYRQRRADDINNGKRSGSANPALSDLDQDLELANPDSGN
ncbi:MAG: VacJ family lipoprotein [Pseudomonadota bacterium]|nr:VacJ family lipoprotein [Pseudomonadota bacterium]